MIKSWNEMDFVDFQWKTYGDSSQADTFIEWCFEEKSLGLKNGSDIVNAWRVRKSDYKSYIATTIYDFQHYSLHDESHSISILNAVELVLGRNRIKHLSASDLWLLLECAYFHDIGMAMTHEDMKTLWATDENFQAFVRGAVEANDSEQQIAAQRFEQMNNLLQGKKQTDGMEDNPKIEFGSEWPAEIVQNILLLTCEYIREHHPQRAREKMEERLRGKKEDKVFNVIDDRLSNLVGMVSELHYKGFDNIAKTLKYQEVGFETEYLHPQFAAAMLRLGDLLDMDNNRFNMRSIEHFGELPSLSKLHYEKHKALTHFNISPNCIMAEAHSGDEKVCQVTEEWFHWLDEEVNDLIRDWNEFAPDKLKGCVLRKCQLKVFWKGEVFGRKEQKNFNVDTQRLIDLMIGSNIYDSLLDCFREYIQNAFDACKIKLWYELEYGRRKWGDLSNITPFELNREYYENLPIEIHVKVEWGKEKWVVRFKIRDYGIGMEEECINNLSIVGKSWKNRALYQKAIGRMPKWMKPTGGFGIGLQSAFMLTDEVKIETKSVNEIKGQSLVMRSPKLNGGVTRQKSEKAIAGTDISFVVDWSTCLEIMGKKMPPEKGKDFFDLQEIENYVVSFIIAYIKKVFPNTIFPIQIFQDDCLVQTHRSSFVKKGYGKEKPFSIKKEKREYLYRINSEDFSAWLWDKEEEAIAYIRCFAEKISSDPAIEPERFYNFCYKGVLVERLKVEEKYFRFFSFLQVNVDFMGVPMQKVMALQRNSFTQNFDVIGYYRKYVEIYLNLVSIELEKELDDEDVHKKINLFLFILASIQLLEKEKALKILSVWGPKLTEQTKVAVKVVRGTKLEKELRDVSEVLSKILDIFSGRKAADKQNKDNALLLSVRDRYKAEIAAHAGERKLFVRTMIDEDLPYYSLDSMQNTVGEGVNMLKTRSKIINLLSTYLKEGAVIYSYPDLTDALEGLGHKFNSTYFKVARDDDNGIYALITGLDEDWEYVQQSIITKEKFLRKAFDYTKNHERYIARNEKCLEYENLQVDTLPSEETRGWYGKRKEIFLISPISRRCFHQILYEANIDALENRLESGEFEMQLLMKKEVFVQIVTKMPDYLYLLDWVWEHQVKEQEKRLDRLEIEKEYRKMIEDIYEENLRKKIKESGEWYE